MRTTNFLTVFSGDASWALSAKERNGTLRFRFADFTREYLKSTSRFIYHKRVWLSFVWLQLYSSEAKIQLAGQEPWYSGYGWRLMFERSWVSNPGAWYRMDIFSHWLVVKLYCLKRPKINEKEAGVGPFLKNQLASDVDLLIHDLIRSFKPCRYW